MSTPELADLAARIVGRAASGERIEAYVARSEQTSIRASRGEIEQHRHGASAGAGVRVLRGTRQGFAWAGSLDDEVLDDVVRQARDNAELSEEDPAVGLADDDGVAPPDLDLVVADLTRRDADEKRAVALELERRVLAADPRISGVRVAAYGDGYGEAAVASSTGLAAWSEGTSASLSVSALADHNGEMRMGSGFDASRDPDDLDMDDVVARAVGDAVDLLGATKPDSARLPVLLDRRVAASFLSLVAGTLTGERVAKGRTPFADRLGETIGSPLLTLVDDPTDPRHLGADTHDDEGLASRRNVLVDDGILRAHLHDSTSARRLGARSTASAVRGTRSTPSPGVRALQIRPGVRTPEEMVADLDDAVLITSVSGLHSGVNPVSGDFSVGIEGRRIRGGHVAEPIREATIASTLQRMLLDLAEVGSDLGFRGGGGGAASLLIVDVSLSGR